MLSCFRSIYNTELPPVSAFKFRILSMSIFVWLICLPGSVRAHSDGRWEITAEDPQSKAARLINVTHSPDCPGNIDFQEMRTNTTSLHFNGRTSIGYGPAGDSKGLDVDFTWEGFFLLPSSTELTSEGGVGARLITQFADKQGDWTRLAIGLSEDQHKTPKLCLFLSGTDGSLTGRGTMEVTRDVWHHFALVHEGTASAATLKWYLDSELCGTVYLGGQENPNRLREPGSAPITFGARMIEGATVNRGFAGRMDEIRFTPQALKPSQLMKFKVPALTRQIHFEFYSVNESTFDWDFSKVSPIDSLAYSALAIPGLPEAFSPMGYKSGWYGATAIRGTTSLKLPQGQYQLLLRTAHPSQLLVGGKKLIDTRKEKQDHSGQKTGEYIIKYHSDGSQQEITVQGLFKESTGAEDHSEFLVAYAPADTKHWRLVSDKNDLELTSVFWKQYSEETKRYIKTLQDERRDAALQRGEQFWRNRHQLAKQIVSSWKVDTPPQNSHAVDWFLLKDLPPHSTNEIPDAAFYRRLSLDIRGRIPTLDELETFLAESAPDKRKKAIDCLLDSKEWSDGWMGYWQDLLAENPSVVYPTLNNSGAFRFYLHRSFLENIPFDRFVSELILMEGSDSSGGTAGFGIATGNDSPPAMKAHVLLNAFLGVDLKCARCHDSPLDQYKQSDLFMTAAYLNDGPLTISAKNVAAVGTGVKNNSIIKTTLHSGQILEPDWAFHQLSGSKTPQKEMVIQPGRPRAELAARITSPYSSRFSDVLVNRLWYRYFGSYLIEDLDTEKERPDTPNGKLLGYLSKSFVENGYDLKKLARVILTSQTYENLISAHTQNGSADSLPEWYPETPRRMTAEQLVDSLFQLAGKDFSGEKLGIDATDRGVANLPRPERAWQFASLPNERDRPALGMPVNQTIVDVMTTFGWNGNRQAPRDTRNIYATPQQPLILFNGLLSQRIVRLSDNSQLTELCVTQTSLEKLVDQIFLTILSRRPTESQREILVNYLAHSFPDRLTGKAKLIHPPLSEFQPDWRKHLEAEQTLLMMQAQKRVDQGEQPTQRLSSEFRERVEDVVWSLINSPEFIFIP